VVEGTVSNKREWWRFANRRDPVTELLGRGHLAAWLQQTMTPVEIERQRKAWEAHRHG